jgi:hypothetical protein
MKQATLIITFFISILFQANAQSHLLAIKEVEVSDSIVQWGKAEDGYHTIDGNLNTAWQFTNDGTVASIKFTFPDVVTLDEISIFNGYGKSIDLFYANGRAKSIRWEASNGSNGNFELDPEQFQEVSFELRISQEISAIEFFLTEVVNGEYYEDIVISEFAFFGQGIDQENRYVGMLPVIVPEAVKPQYLPQLQEDLFIFNNTEYQDDYDPYAGVRNEKLIFWLCFYDPITETIFKVQEGINSVILSNTDEYVITQRTYVGIGPGVYHPTHTWNYVFDHSRFYEFEGLATPVLFEDWGFYGLDEKIFEYYFLPEEFEGQILYEYEVVDGIPNKRSQSTITVEEGTELKEQQSNESRMLSYDPSTGRISGNAWSQTIGSGGGYFELGNGIACVMIVEPDEYPCNQVQKFSSTVYFFDENGLIHEVQWSESNGIFPFQLSLEEDPCSA